MQHQRDSSIYVRKHNGVIPHATFLGQTPDEVHPGRGDGVPYQIAAARIEVHVRRREENRARRCAVCA